MSEQKQPSIEIEHFSFYYPERTEKTLDDLTLTVEQGEFLVLCGPSGCGKSTLLRQLKTVLAPHGRRLGSIRFEGRPLEELDQREQSAGIGFVQQDPENQIVTDKVWHELAFGLESLGYDTPTIGAGWLRWPPFSAFRPGSTRTSRSCPAGRSSS